MKKSTNKKMDIQLDLSGDESEEHQKMVLGGVLISEKTLPTFEADFVQLRIKHKLFGEIKWNRIDQYHKRYCDFIDLFFDKKCGFCYPIRRK